MKLIYSKFLLLCTATALLFGACKKKENKTYYDPTKAKAKLEASASSIVLAKGQETETIVTFTWEKPDFGYSAGVSYSLQFAASVDSFGNPEVKEVGANVLKVSYTVNDMNQLATRLGLLPDSSASIWVKLVAVVEQNGGSNVGNDAGLGKIISDPVELKVRPYSSRIVYPVIFAVGAFQGWNPGAGDSLFSVNSDDKYEGYIFVPGTSGGDLEFKFTSQGDWNGTNYGSGGEPATTGFVTSGTLSTDGGAGNLKVPAGGYYRIKANTSGLTWEAYQTTWGLIGSATPGGWDSSTPMTYDAASKTWIIESVALVPGEIKFRANNAWDLSYGDNADKTGLTADNGSNIAVAEGGNYKVVLNLSNSTHYSYTLTKL